MGVQGRKWPRLAVLVAVLACVLASAAQARRDDLPVELYQPANGTVVKDATHGLAVDFTCPAYHYEAEDALIHGPVDGYHVILADAPDIDENGMLLVANRVDERDAVGLDSAPAAAGGTPPVHCTAAEDDAGLGLLPREPGRYWWQAWRECRTYVCPDGQEPSDVAQITVMRTVCTVQRAALEHARAALKTARKQLARRHTAARRARVDRLTDRVATIRTRLRVVYDCKPA